MKLMKRFPFYDELPIKFDPTYKRDFKQNSIYINKNDQCASYTDRIFFKQQDLTGYVENNGYGCRDEVFGSDHRPVYLD